MSDKKYASPLRINIQESRFLLTSVVLFHAGAIALLFLIEVPVVTRLILVLMVLSSLCWLVLPAPRNMFPRVKTLVWGDDDWLLIDESGNELRGELLPSSFVHPLVTIVNLKILQKPWYCRYRSFVFLNDNIDSETFRRLRVRLRWCLRQDQNSLAETE